MRRENSADNEEVRMRRDKSANNEELVEDVVR